VITPSPAAAQPVYYTRYYSPVSQPVATAPRVVYTQPAAQPVYYTTQPVYTTTAPATTYTTTPTYTTAPTYAAAPAAGGGDAYGFTAWLNNLRASYGLAPVSHDPGLAGWAAQNNNAQASRGLGHHVMGPARRQNSAIGSAASIGAQWLNSPAHRALLLDPTIRTIGLAGAGMYWTLNAQ
jgi:uncharacterized protein YkwD